MVEKVQFQESELLISHAKYVAKGKLRAIFSKSVLFNILKDNMLPKLLRKQ